MFIIEKFTSDYKERVRAWEEARDRWIDDDPSMYGGYRTERDYASKHPRPGTTFFGVLKASVIIIPALLILAFLIFFIVDNSGSSEESKKPETTKVSNGQECQGFKVGDHVRVQYGDYADKVGTIIGGCKSTENYQVKLDDHQTAEIDRDGIEGQTDVSNRTIGVDSTSNLVVIYEPKKQ